MICKHILGSRPSGRLFWHPYSFAWVLNFLQNLPSLLDCIFFDKMILAAVSGEKLNAVVSVLRKEDADEEVEEDPAD